MTCTEIAIDSLNAAQALKPHPRSCISRAYFASYAAVTQALIESRGVKFETGREGPAHKDLSSLIGNHLAYTLKPWRINELKATVHRLYRARLEADYRMSANFDVQFATSVLRDAVFVLRELKIG